MVGVNKLTYLFTHLSDRQAEWRNVSEIVKQVEDAVMHASSS